MVWPVWLIVQIAVTVTSITYQAVQARKARKAAKEAEEARKGFDIVVEGEITPLVIPYGRVKIGGARTWHNVANSFKYVNSNADKTLMVGSQDIPGGTFEELVVTESGTVTATRTSSPILGSALTKDMTGTKNEFLFFQQAICVGPITRVYDVIIDGEKNLDDASLGSVEVLSSRGVVGSKANFKASLRVDVHNGDVAEHDALTVANFPERMTAKFPNAAYASVFAKLNRDDPQFQGVFDVQFILEGRPVPHVVGGVITTYAYSTSVPFALLDYLMSPLGKNLPASKIDLASFEAVHARSYRTVAIAAKVGGKIWKPTDGYRNVSFRQLPRYESNIALKTSDKIRDNINKLLQCLGPTATLVYIQGKYKLVFQDPDTNDQLVVAGELTDDDLVHDTKVNIAWPGGDDRFNYATVKFLNAELDFEEDSVSWPPKVSGAYAYGINGDKYPIVDGWEENAGGKLLNKYGVWVGGLNSASFSWKFVVLNGGNHTVYFTADNSCNILVKATSSVHNNWSTVKNFTIFALKDEIVSVSATAYDTGDMRGFAAYIVDSAGVTVWSSRSPAYTDFITYTQNNSIYNTLKAEDNGVELEASVFAEGIDNAYHALARAEEIVRTSRTAVRLELTYRIQDKYYTPGDYLRVNSDILGIYNKYFRVETSKMTAATSAELSMVGFDASQLAWNVPDNVYEAPESLFDFKLMAPYQVSFSSNLNALTSSGGTVTWTSAADSRSEGFIVYINIAGDYDSNGLPLFREVGRTSEYRYELPPVNERTGRVAVRSYRGNVLSELVESGPVLFNTRSLELSSSEIGFIKDKTNTFVPGQIVISAVVSGYLSPVVRWYVDNVETIASGSLIVPPFTTGSFKKFRVEVEELAEVANESTQIVKEVTLFSIEEGKDTTSMLLTQDIGILPANYAGVVSDFTPGSTTLTLMQGSVNVTPEWVIGRTSSAGVSSTIAGNNSESYTVTGQTSVAFQVTSMSGDSGYIEIVAVKGSSTITRRFNVSKLKSSSSSSFASITVYREAADQPLAPTGGSYTPDGDVFVSPSSWSRALPALGTLPIWASTFGFRAEDATQTIPGGPWSTPVLVARPVVSSVRTAILQMFKWSSTTPVTMPVGSSTYTWATGLFTEPSFNSNGWQLTPGTPTAGQTLYGIRQIYTDTDSSAQSVVNWGPMLVPYALSKAGTDGVSAIGVKLDTLSNVFKYNAAGANTSLDPITFTATVFGSLGDPVWTCKLYNAAGTLLGNVTLGTVTLLKKTLSAAQFSTADYAVVTATAGGYEDTVTVYRVRDGVAGVSALSGYLTNEAHTVPADVGGVVTVGNLATATGSFKVLSGLVNVTASSTFVKLSESGLTGSIDSAGNYSISALSADIGTLTLRASYGGTDITRIFTVSKARQGPTGEAATAPVYAALSNENHTFTANAAGVVTTYAGSGTTIRVFEGADEVLFDNVGTSIGTWRISLATTGITSNGMVDSGRYVTINDFSALSGDSGFAVYTITGKLLDGTDFTLLKQQNFSKSKSGTDGEAGSAFWLTRSAASIRKSNSGVVTPGTLTFNAITSSGDTPSAYLGNFKVYFDSGSGFVEAYSSVAPESEVNYTIPVNAIAVKVELYKTGGFTTLIDFETTPVILDGATGASAVSVILSNELHAVPSDAQGNVLSYDNSGTLIYVYEGPASLDFDQAGAIAGTNGKWGYTTTVSGIATPTGSDGGFPAIINNHSGMTADSASITYNIYGKTTAGLAFSIIKIQSIVKSKQGFNGLIYWVSPSATVVKKSVTNALTPTQIRFSAFKGTAGLPEAYPARFIISTTTNGVDFVPQYTSGANETFKDYAVPANITAIRVAMYATGGTSVLLDTQTVPILQDGATGANGLRYGSMTMYRWSATKPTTFPSGTSTYTWATGAFTTPATTNLWSATSSSYVAGTTLWAVTTTFTDSGNAATSPVVWSVNDCYVVSYAGTNGSDGLSSVRIDIFRRSATDNPVAPNANASYNFATGSLTGLTNSWSTTWPSGVDPVHVRSVSLVGTGTVNVLPTSWSSSVKILQNGANGANGFNTATVFLFKRTTDSGSPAAPSGSLVYNFLTRLIAGDPQGWTTSLPTTGGPYRWVITATANSTEPTDTILSSEWSPASLISQDGINGVSGTKSITLSLYQWYPTMPTNNTPFGTYTWDTNTVNFIDAQGWTFFVPANPGTSGLQLWQLTKTITTSATDNVTNVDWTGQAPASVSINGGEGPPGSAGYQATDIVVFRWDSSTPSIAGSSTYTWSSSSFAPPIGWFTDAGAGSPGLNLYAARYRVTDSATALTSNVNWSGAVITIAGYNGTAGATGPQGPQGPTGPQGTAGGAGPAGAQGVSARRAYIISTSDSLSTPTSTSNDTLPGGWSSNALIPTPDTNQKLFQSDGLYNPITNITTWNTPYISSLRVGSLSAITVNTGGLSVTGNLTMSAGGMINAGSYTGWSWPTTGSGFHLGPNGLLMGRYNSGAYVQLTATGDLYAPGFSLAAGVATFSGTLSGASGTFTGTVSAGQINGSTITGGLIRTAASGKRTVINEGNSNDIRVYGETNNLIVSIGDANDPNEYGFLTIHVPTGSSWPAARFRNNSFSTTVTIDHEYNAGIGLMVSAYIGSGTAALFNGGTAGAFAITQTGTFNPIISNALAFGTGAGLRLLIGKNNVTGAVLSTNNVTVSASGPSGGENGDIWIQT